MAGWSEQFVHHAPRHSHGRKQRGEPPQFAHGREGIPRTPFVTAGAARLTGLAQRLDGTVLRALAFLRTVNPLQARAQGRTITTKSAKGPRRNLATCARDTRLRRSSAIASEMAAAPSTSRPAPSFSSRRPNAAGTDTFSLDADPPQASPYPFRCPRCAHRAAPKNMAPAPVPSALSRTAASPRTPRSRKKAAPLASNGVGPRKVAAHLFGPIITRARAAAGRSNRKPVEWCRRTGRRPSC